MFLVWLSCNATGKEAYLTLRHIIGKTHTILGDAASQQYMTRSAKSTDKLDLPSGAGMLQRICMTLFESIAQMDCVVELSYLGNDEYKLISWHEGSPYLPTLPSS